MTPGVPSPVQRKHLSICKVDVILLLVLQLLEGDGGKGRELLPKDNLEAEVSGAVSRAPGGCGLSECGQVPGPGSFLGIPANFRRHTVLTLSGCIHHRPLGRSRSAWPLHQEAAWAQAKVAARLPAPSHKQPRTSQDTSGTPPGGLAPTGTGAHTGRRPLPLGCPPLLPLHADWAVYCGQMAQHSSPSSSAPLLLTGLAQPLQRLQVLTSTARGWEDCPWNRKAIPLLFRFSLGVYLSRDGHKLGQGEQVLHASTAWSVHSNCTLFPGQAWGSQLNSASPSAMMGDGLGETGSCPCPVLTPGQVRGAISAG